MQKAHQLLILSVLWFALIPRIACAQAVPEEARRHMARGQAAVEMAKSTADYEAAARELEKAKQLAPQWPEVYHALGLLYEKTGNYEEAIESFRGYLKHVPSSPDAAKVQESIYKLEYKRDRNNIEGIWKTVVNETTATCDPAGYEAGRRWWLSSRFVIDDLVLEFRKKPEGDRVRVLSSRLRIHSLPDGSYVPVKRDEGIIKIFGATMYTCKDVVQPDHCPWESKFVLTQVSADELKGTLDVKGAGWHRVSYSKEKDEFTFFQCTGKIVLRRDSTQR